MYSKKEGRHPFKVPWRSALLMVVCLLTVSSAGVLAYLKLDTPSNVTNNFTSAVSVNPEIQENFRDNVKSDVTVSVGDTGYSVYVRAAVVVTWQDAEGHVYVTPPVVGTDYTITYNTSNWEKGKDGYWYYDKAVPSQNSTTALITKCEPLQAAPVDGYTLNVKIIAQTIQSAGTTDGESPIEAIRDAWKQAAP